ncbi:hypothetical protein AMTRI_Chr08g206870 [Amborella trichopoda]
MNGLTLNLSLALAILYAEVMDEILGNGLSPNQITYTALIDGHCKSGKLEIAPSLIERMEKCEGPSRDWDKAWSSFKKQGKKTFFSQFNPEKYVSRNPSRSEYPLLEEVDPIKRSERANLRAWTSTTFTLGGAVVLVSVLLLYTILAPLN